MTSFPADTSAAAIRQSPLAYVREFCVRASTGPVAPKSGVGRFTGPGKLKARGLYAVQDGYEHTTMPGVRSVGATLGPFPMDPLATQLANIQARTGLSLTQLVALVERSGLTKHAEIRDMLQSTLGLGHGDANTLVHHALKSDGASAAQEKGLSTSHVLDEIYAGPKAALRPIHDALMAVIGTWGDFEIAPKKGYVSLRRKKQFAMIGPTTKTRVDVGINARALEGDARLVTMPAGGMCQYQVRLTSAAEVDAQVLAWVRSAFDAAG